MFLLGALVDRDFMLSRYKPELSSGSPRRTRNRKDPSGAVYLSVFKTTVSADTHWHFLGQAEAESALKSNKNVSLPSSDRYCPLK